MHYSTTPKHRPHGYVFGKPVSYDPNFDLQTRLQGRLYSNTSFDQWHSLHGMPFFDLHGVVLGSVLRVAPLDCGMGRDIDPSHAVCCGVPVIFG